MIVGAAAGVTVMEGPNSVMRCGAGVDRRDVVPSSSSAAMQAGSLMSQWPCVGMENERFPCVTIAADRR